MPLRPRFFPKLDHQPSWEQSLHAVRSAIGSRFPQLAKIHLTDFKVRVLDTSHGTGAITRVLIDSTNGSETWSTIGVSENIIEASWRALEDSLVFGLLHTDG